MLWESASNGVNCDTNQASPRKLGSLYLKVTKNVHDAPLALIAPKVSRLQHQLAEIYFKAKLHVYRIESPRIFAYSKLQTRLEY